jgi:hypothetical protein
MRSVALWYASAAALALSSACSFDASGRPGGGSQDGDLLVDANQPGPDGDGPLQDGAVPPDAGQGDFSCEPGETFCDGRTVRTCNEDGDGAVDGEDEECAFTCADAQCVFASNLPEGALRACDASAPALTPPSGASVTFERVSNTRRIACDPHCGDGSTSVIASTAQQSQGSDPTIRVFCLERVSLDSSHTVGVSNEDPIEDAIALIVDGPVVIEGVVDVSGREAASDSAGRRGPGGWNGGGRANGNGNPGEGACGGDGGDRDADAAGGGGGGGHQGNGGDGGDGKDGQGNSASGGAGRGGCGNAALSPLVGGYGGGSGASGSCGSIAQCGWPGGGGGGGIQISSRVSILIDGGGAIIANGGDGYGESSGPGAAGGGGGGGSGGAILLEAPEVTLAQPDALRVDGGRGGASAAGSGGAGASGTFPDGEDGSDFNGNSGPGGGSGGGGGGGRVRLNSEAGDALCTRVSPRGGICTNGTLRRDP